MRKGGGKGGREGKKAGKFIISETEGLVLISLLRVVFKICSLRGYCGTFIKQLSAWDKVLKIMFLANVNFYCLPGQIKHFPKLVQGIPKFVSAKYKEKFVLIQPPDESFTQKKDK